MKGKILVTGGAGYIGSHTCLELLLAGHEVCALDNLANGSREALRRVEKLAGRKLDFKLLDLLDAPALARLVQGGGFSACVHFAALKAVGESSSIPLAYYRNNITGTLNLLTALDAAGVRDFVFSSSATVYGEPQKVPITEDFPLRATNPYGRTKLMCEEILRDLAAAPSSSWRIALLRYFNPVGSHESGLIGEDPKGLPNNLLPYVARVAVGRIQELQIFGADYATPDGTGVRDYIHVADLAAGHVKALRRLADIGPGAQVWNLGTGRGYSVLEMVAAFGKASGRSIPYRVVARRPGDVAACYADASKALRELGWKAERGLAEICRDAWRFQSSNPEGYPPEPS